MNTKSNPYKAWKRYTDVQQMKYYFEKDNPDISGWDTETTGLHVKKDKPFLIVFGWIIPGKDYGRVFTFYPTKENMELFLNLAEKTKAFVGHNFSYDLSMIRNIGYNYTADNVYENTVVARLIVEAIPQRMGGDSLALTDLGVKYVHPDAKNSEQIVKRELRKLNDDRVKYLSAALKEYDHPFESKMQPMRKDGDKWVNTTQAYIKNNPDAETKIVEVPRKWTKGLVEDFLKDITNDVEDLPEEIHHIWNTWQQEYPEPNYSHIDRDLMMQYASEDVITMLEFFKKAIPLLKKLKQVKTLKRENKLIYPICDMERSGIKVDLEYLENSRQKLKSYIVRKRKEMYQLAGNKVNVGQHATIIRVFKNNWGIELFTCNKGDLDRLKDSPDVPEDARRYAELISELRRLEKWYSTYIVRTIEKASYDGRQYMSLNQAGAVSGRFSSDGQQVPRGAIYDDEGNELYNPRRAYLADEGTIWYFLDYSQVELRNQANYTLLVSGGDMNLCRAYIPFKCKGTYQGVTGEFNYKDPEKRKYWKLENFWRDEEGNFWTPTDVHSQTAHNSLMELGYKTIKRYKHYVYKGEGKGYFGDEITNFEEVRDTGKTFNFMRNYGGGIGAAMTILNLPEHVAQALVIGYSEAFPHVEKYQQAVIQQHFKKGYVENMYGRRYYLMDIDKAYTLANYLIQGTCADMMKEAVIRIYEYLKKQQCQTKMIMTVHDEIFFSSVPGEEHIIEECKRIMEDNDWHMIPIIADIEKTTTSWADKEEGL